MFPSKLASKYSNHFCSSFDCLISEEVMIWEHKTDESINDATFESIAKTNKQKSTDPLQSYKNQFAAMKSAILLLLVKFFAPPQLSLLACYWKKKKVIFLVFTSCYWEKE